MYFCSIEQTSGTRSSSFQTHSPAALSMSHSIERKRAIKFIYFIKMVCNWFQEIGYNHVYTCGLYLNCLTRQHPKTKRNIFLVLALPVRYPYPVLTTNSGQKYLGESSAKYLYKMTMKANNRKQSSLEEHRRKVGYNIGL